MPTFEENLSKLEEIIKKLEDKNVSLEDLVTNYTKGLELTKECYDILNEKDKLVALKMTELGLETLEDNNNQQEFEENL